MLMANIMGDNSYLTRLNDSTRLVTETTRNMANYIGKPGLGQEAVFDAVY